MKNILLKPIVAFGLSITLTNAQNYEARGVGSIGQQMKQLDHKVKA